MTILTLTGSTHPESSNAQFLRAFAKLAPQHTWVEAPNLGTLPLFTTEALEAGRPAPVEQFAQAVLHADAILVCTPEYAHNVPAALKSALEWLVASGEFAGKRTIALTATPAAPRGERCMQSMVWTLKALDAQVLAELPVYAVGQKLDANGCVADATLKDEMRAVIEVLEQL